MEEKIMKVGIIGVGHVGTAMNALFKDAVLYDKFKNIRSMNEINKCDAAFVCVPTPMREDGSCDTSAVEEVISLCTCPLLILRSTVKVGFTKNMVNKYHKKIVFQPEYDGETLAHPFANLSDRSWLSFGGEQDAIDMAIEVYQSVINSNVRIYQADSDTVEMAKYMENAYLATKVIFCNEIYDICERLGISYNKVREIWIADTRIGSSHTFVYKNNRGYGGSCLPKDISSISKQAKENGLNPKLLDAVISKNKDYKGE